MRRVITLACSRGYPLARFPEASFAKNNYDCLNTLPELGGNQITEDHAEMI
jgi:hypothetical protein